MTASSKMTFRRFGRSHHLRIATANDLRLAAELDEAHWVATGAPIDTLESDRTFLSLVDSDANGRIMCFELTAAIRWLLETLGDHGGVEAGEAALRLDAINADCDDGRRIRLAARKMLARAGGDDDETITLEQVRRIKSANGAATGSASGLVQAASAKDPKTSQFIADIIATVGPAGVGREQLDAFLAAGRAYLDWLSGGEAGGEAGATDIMPLGQATAEAFAAFAAVREKVEEYFAQCRAVALDAALAERIGPDRDSDMGNRDAVEQMLESAPLARPRADRSLRFDAPVNPCYAERLTRLREKVVAPLHGAPAEALSEDQWRRVTATFAAHEAWLKANPAPNLAPLGAEKLREYLRSGKGAPVAAVEALIAQSAASAIATDNVRLTEKLILYQAHLLALANNFVSFPHLYDPDSRAMFEMGSLVMDGRRFNFCLRADNHAEHSRIAKAGNMFVLYVEAAAREGGEKLTLAVPVTSGSKGNLCVSKRGLFIDTAGREYDARVVRIIENPISVAEAIISPFRRLGRLLTGKIEALTTKADKTLDTQASAALSGQPAAGGAAAGKGSGGMLAGGLLVGGGVAIAAIGSAVAYMTKTLSQVSWYAIVIGIACAVLAVMLPTAIIAMTKLRRRDLSAILEGAGWAINARMRLTRRQGRQFTQSPPLPTRSRRLARRLLWPALLAAAAAAATIIYLATR